MHLALLDESKRSRYNTGSILKRETEGECMFESKLKNESVDLLAKAFLSLRDEEECYRLFEDLFTIKEIQDLSSRMVVALMLSQKATYSEIVEKTRTSTATIGRVNRALNYGAGGYERVIERLKGTDK